MPDVAPGDVRTPPAPGSCVICGRPVPGCRQTCSPRCRVAAWRRDRAREHTATLAQLLAENAAFRQRVGELERLVGHPARHFLQRGSGGANRRSGFATWSGSQIGTSCHQPERTGTGTYSVVQPHHAGMWSVRPGCQPCGRRCRRSSGSEKFCTRDESRRRRVRPYQAGQFGQVGTEGNALSAS
jgi:predicted nucleic acid-binding Zn ribbon protein